ncbi:hypothetical protein EVAR_5925_1 [Eumeta japonica]|uniref:Uncharacterized protein n=1 Tax=Eumeta variegata TaxID=151549 RepID=A0A4C1TEU8_EUMVA|nr:hypothetical protein EVAR_5925_1 [Eumeta japonica]
MKFSSASRVDGVRHLGQLPGRRRPARKRLRIMRPPAACEQIESARPAASGAPVNVSAALRPHNDAFREEISWEDVRVQSIHCGFTMHTLHDSRMKRFTSNTFYCFSIYSSSSSARSIFPNN